MEIRPEIKDKIQYAGFTKRLKAFGFDYLVICGYIILLVAATMAVVKVAGFMGRKVRKPHTSLQVERTP